MRKVDNIVLPVTAAGNVAEPLGFQPPVDLRPASSQTPLLWLTVLSLDAPAVAALWQLLFARSFHVRLGYGITVLLALAVWLIYVADRALDTLKSPATVESARHIFYRRHLWAFVVPFCAGLVIAGWMALTQLDARTFRYGVVLSVAVGAYFLSVHKLAGGRNWLPKEMLVGVLFAIGTCFPVWERMPHGTPPLAPYLLFTALCWLNCAAIEFEEWKRLRHGRFGTPHPWTVWMGRRFALLSLIVGAASLCYLVFGIGHFSRQLLASELLSAVAFASIRHRGESLSIDRFRVLMDVALFTPALFLLFWRAG